MKIAVLASNPSFIDGVVKELDAVRGHNVLLWQSCGDAPSDYWGLGMAQAADAAFVDFAQYPCQQILAEFQGRITVRAHRVEMYLDGLEEWAWERCDALVFVSEAVRDRFCERLRQAGRAPKSVHVLPGVGVDLDVFRPSPSRAFDPPWRVLIAGNLVPKKRVYTAIQMLADWPEEFKLVIVGSGGMAGYGNQEYHVNCGDLIEELGLQGRVELHPKLSRPDLAHIMQRCHLILSASNEEGCHSTIAEGMATGCVPMVNCWRGAQALYGAEAIWRTPLNLLQKLEAWAALPASEKQALAQSAVEAASKFDAGPVNRALADIIEGASRLSAEVIDPADLYGGEAQRAALHIAQQHCPRGGSFLQLFSGRGFIVSGMVDHASRAMGLEPDSELYRDAVARSPEGARFYPLDPATAIPRGPWDCIAVFFGLERLPADKIATVLRAAAGHLQDGGRLIVQLAWAWNNPSTFRIRPKLVRKLLTECGLVIIEYGSIAGTAFLIVAGRKGGNDACT